MREQKEVDIIVKILKPTHSTDCFYHRLCDFFLRLLSTCHLFRPTLLLCSRTYSRLIITSVEETIMFISTKEVMLSPVSVCLFVFLSVYINILPVLINYRLNLYEILRKYLDLIFTDPNPLCTIFSTFTDMFDARLNTLI